MNPRFTGLWQHRDFMRLWTGQTISAFGSMITRDALPFIAVLVLRATPAQMGLFVAASTLPVLLFGLLAGVWVDRLRRRPILIITDLVRAFLLLTIPVAALLGRLTIEQLYLIVFLTGVLTVLFDVAYQSYLPTLVQREHIVEGNSKLGMSSSVAEVAGPAIVGTLVQIISAPLTILMDAISFVFSAIFMGSIRTPEPETAPTEERRKVWQETASGFQAVWNNPLLRPLVASAATLNLAYGIIGPVIYIYALNELGFSPALWGILVSVGGIGAVFGAFLAGPAARRFGAGKSIIGGLALSGATTMLVPLAGGPILLSIAYVGAAQLFGDTAAAIYGINERSLRQTVTPDHLLGRAGATLEFLSAGIALIGAIIGGILGEIIGVRLTIAVGATGAILGCLWMYFSPVRSLKSIADAALTDH